MDLQDAIATRFWRFFHSGNPHPVTDLKLAPGGAVLGYAHPNESRWGLVDGCLAFYRDDGAISTVFDQVEASTDGLSLSGRFRLEDIGVTLRLETLPENAGPSVPAPTLLANAERVARLGWSIGDYTYGEPDIVEPEMGHLTIGRFCSIAIGVTIVLGNHNHRFATTYPFATLRSGWPAVRPGTQDHVGRGPTVIGHDVWIGKGATILGGITVGDGAVIGAQALVTKSVAPYAIVGGNPTRVLAHRFPDDVIVRLLTLRWWDWPWERLNAMLPLMLSEDIRAFLDAAERLPDEP